MSDLGKDKEALRIIAGQKVVSEEEAKISRNTYLHYRGARSTWYNDRVDNDRFYHGVQYEQDEENEIKARGQAPLVINITYSIIKQIIALLTSNQPMWSADPVGDSDKEIAYALRRLLEATWYNSRGHRQLSQIIKECAITGVGYGMVNPTTNSTFGAEFTYIPYHQVYLDPFTRDFDYNDADNIILSKVITTSQAAKFLNLTQEEVNEYSKEDNTMVSEDPKTTRYARYAVPATTSDQDTKRVRLIQRLSLEMRKVYIAEPLKEGFPVSRRVYFEKDERLEVLAAKGILRINEVEKRVLAKYISVGSHCEKYYLPIDKYNIIPFIDEFNGNPYPLGELDFLYGLQRSLNKFILLAILNATLANNMKMKAPKGSVDKIKYEQDYATPGVLIEYEWEKDMPGLEQINPMSLPGQFFDFPKMLISMMEYVTGIFGVVQGNPQEAPRTASGLMSLQNYGGQKIKLLGRNINDALTSCGDVAIQLFQNYSGFNQVVTYFDDVKLQTVRFNTLIPDDKGNIKIENDLTSGQYRARAMVRQDYGGERQGKAQVLANIMAQTKTPALLKPILKLADIPEIDEIIGEVDALNQAQSQIAELQKSMKRIQEVNKQLENEVIQRAQDVELTKFEANLKIIEAEAKKHIGIGAEKELAGIRESLMQAQQPTTSQ